MVILLSPIERKTGDYELEQQHELTYSALLESTFQVLTI